MLQCHFFQICPNGLVCFNKRYESYSIPANGDTENDLKNIYCLAPYFADVNLQTSGRVWYQDYDLTSNDVADSNEVVVKMQNLVNETFEIIYNPVYILKATWDQAPKYGGSSSEVCVRS